MIKPIKLGLDPIKFPSWRPQQEEAIMDAMSRPERFIGGSLPTGSGKSLFAVAQALLGHTRGAYITSTKALSLQLSDDFGSVGMVEIKGKNNYLCILDDEGATTVDHGICAVGELCKFKKHGCTYYDALHVAYRASLVNTNYDFWLYNHEYGEGLGSFDFLILDEAHDAVDKLSDFLSVRIPAQDLEWMPTIPAQQQFWAEWARGVRVEIAQQVKSLSYRGPLSPAIVRRILHLKRLHKELWRIAGSGDGKGWVLEHDDKGAAVFQLLWPNTWAEPYLFRGVPKILAMSATLRPKTLQLMGVKTESMYFMDYPSDFPVSRRPVIHVPTVSMNYKNERDPAHFGALTDRIDQIIRTRQDRKGIIHTVSYRRADEIVRRSRHRGLMLSHDRRTLPWAVEQYRARKGGAVLVSPSVDTGWDFPGDECEYQIIVKIPFPDSRSVLMEARSADDKDYVPYITMNRIVQMAGRGMRSREDRCETFILDDNWGNWFLRKNRKFAPRWFLDAVSESHTVPAPPLREVT